MQLNWLALHWERLARRDPYFAVLTDVHKRFGGRDVAAFYRTGVEEIAATLRRAEDRSLTVPRRRALDFGCGVGRLTLALADMFERADGVDLSAAMLAVARKNCRHPERCTFHRNAAENLALFGDGTFSFVYSTLVLQHMAPRLSTIYIRELVRVLAADGLLVFQLPSHRQTLEDLTSDVRTAVTGPMPREAFQARLSVNEQEIAGHGGEQIMLRVSIENRSPVSWPALADARGRYRIHVANRWLDARAQLIQRDDARAELPFDVTPGSRADVIVGIRLPRVNGPYALELDLVQENVAWFAEHGSPPLRIPCHVTGGLDAPPPAVTPVVSPPPPAPARFGERHPAAFAILSATGVRDGYWKTRRAIDVVKAHRDSAIRSWLHPVVHELIHPVIRRRVHPLVNRWNRISLAPRMEMHCVPRADVAAAVRESGGQIIDVEEEAMAGGYHSCRYWITKPQAAACEMR